MSDRKCQVAIVDHGLGNLYSVKHACLHVGLDAEITFSKQDILNADAIIVPGVGACPAAMQELKARGLIEPITSTIASGKPYLGICLGLQLLFEASEEGEGTPGLGVLKGRVRRFAVSNDLKIPHMGWNQMTSQKAKGKSQTCPLLEGIPEDSFFYFVHSYYADPGDRAVVALETDYGGRFASMVWRDNLFATQFHPEKSQALGLRLLKNFVAL